jgi:predicted negative regulator of RcsB-dependent stress response
VEIYDTEEEQVEALKRWWKENGTSTIVGLALGIAIILGWNYWQGHKKDQTVQASAIYDQLLKAVEDDKKTQEIIDVYKSNLLRNMQPIAAWYRQLGQGDFAATHSEECCKAE